MRAACQVTAGAIDSTAAPDALVDMAELSASLRAPLLTWHRTAVVRARDASDAVLAVTEGAAGDATFAGE